MTKHFDSKAKMTSQSIYYILQYIAKKCMKERKIIQCFIKTYSSKPNILTKIKIFQTDHLQKNALL